MSRLSSGQPARLSTRDHDRQRAAEAKARHTALLTAIVFTLAIWLVNSTSILMESARMGSQLSMLEPFLLEGTSVIVMLGLYLALAALDRRLPIGDVRWPVALIAYGGGFLAFTLAHTLGMAGLRGALWPLVFDRPYNMFGTSIAEVLLYEGRKDAISFISMLGFLYLFRTLARARLDAMVARMEARETRRVTLKCGGRIMHPPAADFRSAKAAGNYVEARFGDTRHLARMTLAELQTQLKEAGVDAVRVHRSWLIDRGSVTQIAPTGEGDVSIMLDDGEVLPGSRRYRDRLGAA